MFSLSNRSSLSGSVDHESLSSDSLGSLANRPAILKRFEPTTRDPLIFSRDAILYTRAKEA